MNHQKV